MTARRLEFALSSGSNWQPAIIPVQVTENYAANATWTAPAWVSTITVRVWGPGGAGSGRATSNGRGGGGGGGAFAENTVSVTPGQTNAIIVGVGGIGDAANGTAGSNTTFAHNNGTVVVRAAFGINGANAAANGTGGAGGTVANSIGSTRFAGGLGADGNATNSGGGGGAGGNLGIGGAGSNAAAGLGNGTNSGNGGAPVAANAVGVVGNNYGGGGSGARRNAGTRVGGNGAPGYVQIIYTPAPPIVLANAGNLGNGASTAQLTAPSGRTSGANFQAGRASQNTNPTADLTFGSNNYTEDEWSVKAVSGVAVNADVYKFRVTASGANYDTYTVTPTWTIGTGQVQPPRSMHQFRQRGA